MSILSLLPAPTPILIGGTSYPILPFTVLEIREIQSWINRSYKSPLAYINLGELDPVSRQAVLASAKSWQPPKLGTEEANAMLMDVDGLAEVFRILITKSNPSVTAEDVTAIQGSMTFEDFSTLMEQLMEVAFGKDSDPKATE